MSNLTEEEKGKLTKALISVDLNIKDAVMRIVDMAECTDCELDGEMVGVPVAPYLNGMHTKLNELSTALDDWQG